MIELYSSEGCSSCPPAEAWVSQLKSSPELWTRLFPVAFHVDYWNGLGWPDRFARAAYTERQREYAAHLGQDSVYTPEFVVNGREWRGWFAGQRDVSKQAGTEGELTVTGGRDGRGISARYAAPAGDSRHNYTANVALLGVNIVSKVARGENAGRDLEHDFVVLNFASKPLILGKEQSFQTAPFDLLLSTPDRPGALVAWVSTDDGAIKQIAGGWLRPSVAAGMGQ